MSMRQTQERMTAEFEKKLQQEIEARKLRLKGMLFDSGENLQTDRLSANELIQVRKWMGKAASRNVSKVEGAHQDAVDFLLEWYADESRLEKGKEQIDRAMRNRRIVMPKPKKKKKEEEPVGSDPGVQEPPPAKPDEEPQTPAPEDEE